ncbi:MAG: hypothetical protein NZ602_09915 [Thermoguttaceae bacterium]|nr:hypothetical protein [Thermoguttaceae bacterium]MDW8037128.1 hypothetical protein [Thermoguttaceae bacterium]
MALLPQSNSGRWWQLGVGLVVVSMFCTGCGESPQAAYQTIIQYGRQGQYEKIWDRIDKKSQGKLEVALKGLAAVAALGAALGGKKQEAEELGRLSPKELFVRLCEKSPQILEHFDASEIKSVQKEGDRARLTVVVSVKGQPQERQITMIREDGIWKLSIDWELPTPKQ